MEEFEGLQVPIEVSEASNPASSNCGDVISCHNNREITCITCIAHDDRSDTLKRYAESRKEGAMAMGVAGYGHGTPSPPRSSHMPPSVKTVREVGLKELKVGDRVVRGPEWRWEDQDSNGEGTVRSFNPSNNLNVRVDWDNGHDNTYSYKEGDRGIIPVPKIMMEKSMAVDSVGHGYETWDGRSIETKGEDKKLLLLEVV